VNPSTPTRDAAARPRTEPDWPILAALGCLDQLLAQAVSRLHAALGADPFRGLHIGPEDVDRWLADPVEGTALAKGLTSTAAGAVEAALDDPAMGWLAETLSLSAFQIAAVLIAFAPELDLRYERLYAYLQDDVAKRRPTVDLALRLLCPDRVSRARRIAEFAPDAPLAANRLVAIAAPLDQPLLAASLQLDPQIAALLLRHTHLDPRLAPFTSVSLPEIALASLPIEEGWRTALPSLLADAQERRAPLRFHLQGPPGVGKARLAEAIAAQLGVRLISADARGLGALSDADDRLRLLFREAWLKGGVLHLSHVDAVAEEDSPSLSVLLRLLAVDGGVVVLSGVNPWIATTVDGVGLVPLVFDTAAPGVQQASWRAAFAHAEVPFDDDLVATLAERFRLKPSQAVEAIASAASGARWRTAQSELTGGPASLTPADLFAAARLQCGHELARLARRIEPRRGWDDIVLPEDSMAQLREICTRIAHHGRVLREWGFSQRLSLGKGVTALFAGPSGTGKTLAAEIIAYELGLFLYKVDLSSVVSKYIGETEKNLDRIFSAARDANCVLFFDEADALFGKRSEVRDSHDRYANLEISYLLQKMEEFEGLAILATNLRQNLDDAFTRRLAFTVHFPFPDEQERSRIWTAIWPVATPLAEDVDAGSLARELKMSGGNIKNTALAAAYYAAADGGVVTRAHLLHAAKREFQKMGKVPAALESAAVAGTS
jgi:ATP-dependent 26S proteasome regulatory subunit